MPETSTQHFNIKSDACCVLCGSGDDEIVEHLFFTCAFNKRCWEKLGVRFSSPNIIKDTEKFRATPTSHGKKGVDWPNVHGNIYNVGMEHLERAQRENIQKDTPPNSHEAWREKDSRTLH